MKNYFFLNELMAKQMILMSHEGLHLVEIYNMINSHLHQDYHL